jgi:hypothetical protein
MTPGLMLRVGIVRHIHWKGRLIVIFVIEADYLANFPKLCFTGKHLWGRKCSLNAPQSAPRPALRCGKLGIVLYKGRSIVISGLEDI